jgi:hypothetical protein
MVFIDPGTLRHLEWSYPQSEREPLVVHLVAYVTYALREQICIWSGVFSARILVALVYEAVFVPKRSEILLEPRSIGEYGILTYSIVESRSGSVW